MVCVSKLVNIINAVRRHCIGLLRHKTILLLYEMIS